MATSHPPRKRPTRIAAAMFITGLSLACATLAHPGTSELTNRDWRLLSMHGKRILPTFGMREPYVRLSADSLRMSGWGGCNRISGTATADAGHLTFGPILATKMACADAQLNRQESDLLAVLRETSLYQIIGDTLILSQDSQELARLTAGAR